MAVSTASHGGIAVASAALERIPEPLRQTGFSAGRWFEEDCDWAIPYLALGLHAFEPERDAAVRLAARRTIWRWHKKQAELLGVDEDPTFGPPREGAPGAEEEGKGSAG